MNSLPCLFTVIYRLPWFHPSRPPMTPDLRHNERRNCFRNNRTVFACAMKTGDVDGRVAVSPIAPSPSRSRAPSDQHRSEIEGRFNIAAGKVICPTPAGQSHLWLNDRNRPSSRCASDRANCACSFRSCGGLLGSLQSSIYDLHAYQRC